MFRVTPNSQMNTAIFQSQHITSRLASLQGQASSGLKYTRPSDNPLDTAKIGGVKRTLSYLQTQQRNIGSATSRLNSGVSQLVEANQLLTRAKQIALQAPQSTGAAENATLAKEVDSLIDRFLAIANHQEDGDYLFSGDALDKPPFQVTERDGLAIPHTSYQGSTRAAFSFISQSIIVASSYSGGEVFARPDRQPSLYFGQTGAASGAGVDSEVGRTNLSILHESTAYDPASGIVPGVSSPGGDTIVGPASDHYLLVNDTSGDGSSGTVRLNDGSQVDWTSTDTDLEVLGPRGEKVFLDMSSVTAGFNNFVSIDASGSLSLDGGQTRQPIDFSENQIVKNEITGGIVYVNSEEIRYSGVESIEFPGTADALTALMELKEDLVNPNGLDPSQLNPAFDRRVGELGRLSDHVLDVVGSMSVSLQDLEQLSFQNDNQQLENNTRLADLESADMAAVIIEMQGLQSALQFNYASLSIVQSNNLLDFLG